MKNTKKCPKCDSGKIAVSTGTEMSSVNTILAGLTYFRAVPCDKFICLECGYVEQWVHDADGLAKIDKECRRYE